jgi:hypothetical protein
VLTLLKQTILLPFPSSNLLIAPSTETVAALVG